MQKIITALNKILTRLCEIQHSAWMDKRDKNWKPTQHARETYEFVSHQRLQSIQPIKPEDVNDFFSLSEKSAAVNFFKENKVLYLPPLKKDVKDAGFVPVFSLCCNLSRDQSVARFRVMLVSLDKDDKTTLNGIGFRMETPDGRNRNANMACDDTTGNHNFYHAQLIQQFSPKQFGNKLQTECPSWLPNSQPSFPLPADCPVTLLLCLIGTIYGRKYYHEICGAIRGIDQYKNKLPL